MSPKDEDFVTERWTCAGVRVEDGKRVVTWLQADGKSTISYPGKASYVLGGGYYVMIAREDEHTWMRGTPRYAGSGNATDEQYARFRVLSTEAEQQLARDARERKAKGTDPLSDAMKPLVTYAQQCRTRSQRAALIADVIDRLNFAAWGAR